MSNFDDILSQTAGEAEKPKPFPVGHYTADIKEYDVKEIGQKNTPCIEITYQLTGALADVDPDDFEAAGGDAKLMKRTVRGLQFLTEDSKWRLDEFLRDVCGLELDGRSYGELLPELTDVTDLVVEIDHRPGKDGDEIYMDVKKVHGADFEIEA